MTDPTRALTEEELAEIERLNEASLDSTGARWQQYEHPLVEYRHVRALIAEVRKLRAMVSGEWRYHVTGDNGCVVEMNVNGEWTHPIDMSQLPKGYFGPVTAALVDGKYVARPVKLPAPSEDRSREPSC